MVRDSASASTQRAAAAVVTCQQTCWIKLPNRYAPSNHTTTPNPRASIHDPTPSQVTWPESLKHLEFGHLFRQSLVGATWPQGLEELKFGGFYNCSLEDAELPEGLRALDLGRSFNRGIADTRFPDGLWLMTFGDSFDQPVEGVRWPSSLRVSGKAPCVGVYLECRKA